MEAPIVIRNYCPRTHLLPDPEVGNQSIAYQSLDSPFKIPGKDSSHHSSGVRVQSFVSRLPVVPRCTEDIQSTFFWYS